MTTKEKTVIVAKYFRLGQVCATPGVIEEISVIDQMTALQRHASCEWGELDPADWAENELSLREGFRLLSAYHSSQGVKFWIITEADRSVTSMLLPSEC